MLYVAGINAARVRVYDANGLEWDYVRECDDETGRIVQLKRENGQFVMDETGMDIARVETMTAAPLLLVPIEEMP